MNKLQFNISCNTAEEAILEVQKLEKAFNKPIECYVNIVMYEKKEPTELTVDPKLKTRLLCDFSLVEHLLTEPAMRLWCQH